MRSMQLFKIKMKNKNRKFYLKLQKEWECMKIKPEKYGETEKES